MRNSTFYITKPIVYECLPHNPFRRCNFSSDSGDSQCLTKPRYKWALYDKSVTDNDPHKTSIILFPGQGSHFVGMGKDLIKLPKIKQMFQCANEILRTDILRTCLEGPASKLSKTIHCQPATFIISLAALVKLREENEELIKNCVVTAGFSLGEISALVFSGALTYEEGLHIIRVRAEAMQKACDEKAGAMITVFVNPGSPLKLGIAAAINHCEVRHKIQNPCCKVANYLYPDCKVIAGNKEAIDFIENHAGQFGIRRTKRLPVNGAFHTPLMSSARKIIANSLDRMGDFQEPSIPVISAVDVLPYRGTMNIKRKLAMQVYTSVLRICKKPGASINIWNLLKYFAITINGAGHSRKHSRSPPVNRKTIFQGFTVRDVICIEWLGIDHNDIDTFIPHLTLSHIHQYHLVLPIPQIHSFKIVFLNV